MSLAQMSLYGAAMIAVVLVIRTLGMHKLPKWTFLLLWGMIVLRLLVPFSLTSPFSVYALVQPSFSQEMTTLQVPRPVPLAEGTITEQTGAAVIERTASLDSWQLIWLVIMLALLLYFMLCYYHCHREFQMSLPVKQDFVEQWLKAHPLKRSIAVRISDRIQAPLTYGYRHPVILLPKDMDWQDTKQLEHILLHEYVHIRRMDGIAKLLLTAAVCIHWFNPLVWLMYHFATRDLELACDEAVLTILEGDQRAEYAWTLVHMEQQKKQHLPLYSQFGSQATEERIKAIMKMKRKSITAVVFSGILVLAVFVGLATDARLAEAHYQTEPFSKTAGALQLRTTQLIEAHEAKGWPLAVFSRVSKNIEQQIKALEKRDNISIMVWPCPASKQISLPYGERVHPLTQASTLHPGIDIAASKGEMVIAAAAGQVRTVSYDDIYGNFVLIDHGGQLTTLYGQLEEAMVQEGESVTSGQTIGLVGSTGKSTGAHLHFELRLAEKPVDPENYIH